MTTHGQTACLFRSDLRALAELEEKVHRERGVLTVPNITVHALLRGEELAIHEIIQHISYEGAKQEFIPGSGDCAMDSCNYILLHLYENVWWFKLECFALKVFEFLLPSVHVQSTHISSGVPPLPLLLSYLKSTWLRTQQVRISTVNIIGSLMVCFTHSCYYRSYHDKCFSVSSIQTSTPFPYLIRDGAAHLPFHKVMNDMANLPLLLPNQPLWVPIGLFACMRVCMWVSLPWGEKSGRHYFMNFISGLKIISLSAGIVIPLLLLIQI